MKTPKLYKAKLTHKEMLNKRDLLVEYTLVEPTNIDFDPGQFINLNVGENTFRSYSIASPITKNNSVELVVSVDHEGIGSNYLKVSSIGDETKIIGPSGRFTLPENLINELVFIATGTGVAPFIPMFYKLVDLGYKGKISLCFGVRNEDEIFFVDKFEDLKTKLDFTYKICVSQPGPNWNGAKGKVTELLEISDFNNKQFFLCGHPLMIEDMIKRLTEKGVATTNIFHEKFTVSKKN